MNAHAKNPKNVTKSHEIPLEVGILDLLKWFVAKGKLDLPAVAELLAPKSPTRDYKMDDLLMPAEASTFLGCSQKTLANKRSIGNGPKYSKLTGCGIRYRYSDLAEFAQAGVKTSTSDKTSASPDSSHTMTKDLAKSPKQPKPKRKKAKKTLR